MTKTEFDLYVEAVKKRLYYRTEGNPAYKQFLNFALPPRKYNEQYYAKPVPFQRLCEKRAEKGLGSEYDDVSVLARRMNDKLNDTTFAFREEVLITHAKGFLFLIIGKKEIEKFKTTKKQDVQVYFGSPDEKNIPCFESKDLIDLRVKSRQKGALYLFHIDSASRIRPLIPKRFKQPAEFQVVAKKEFSVSKHVNPTNCPDQDKWKFEDGPSGANRVLAVTVDDPHPVTISREFLLDTYSYPCLLAHREVERGMPPPAPAKLKDIREVDSKKIAIGFADYYFQA